MTHIKYQIYALLLALALTSGQWFSYANGLAVSKRNSNHHQHGHLQATVHNLRARYDAVDDLIFVEWNRVGASSVKATDRYLLRYKVNNDRLNANYAFAVNNWRYAPPTNPGENYARLPAATFQNNDELLIQVKPESAIDWTDSLIVSIAKHTQIGDTLVDESNLLPPLNFTANVLAPDAVRLEWRGSPSEASTPSIYYIIDIEQLTVNNVDEPPTQHKQIKTETKDFLLGELNPGERYQLTIRSATSADHVSSTVAIVEITLPNKDDVFEVGNLIISSRFKASGSGVVNLTWEVPTHLQGKIVSYNVEYAEERNENDWQQIYFPGNSPTHLLHNLKGDTNYVLKIKTKLTNGVETESGMFKFRTPRVPPNPIAKVDVIYSSETSAIRVQWILAPHISVPSIAGYDVYITENSELPESAWRFLPLNAPEPEISLDDLRRSTTYFIKIKIRNIDGTVIESPSIYKFTTVENVPQFLMESRLPDLLSYSNVGTGRVSINWAFQSLINDRVIGSRIHYTENHHQPLERWQKFDVENSQQRNVLLVGLRPHTVYYVKIVPMLDGGILDYASVEELQLRTAA